MIVNRFTEHFRLDFDENEKKLEMKEFNYGPIWLNLVSTSIILLNFLTINKHTQSSAF